MTLMSTDDLRAMDLLDRAGNRIGGVRDVLLDGDSGRTRYVVVALGQAGLAGALGIGERLIPIPFRALRLETGRMVLSRDATALAAAPSYTRSHPPSFEAVYCAKLADFWGVEADDADGDDAVHHVVAGDLAHAALPRVGASADLATVARTLAARGADAARVVDEQGTTLGIVTLRDVGLALGRTHSGAPRWSRSGATAGESSANVTDQNASHGDPGQSRLARAPDTTPVTQPPGSVDTSEDQEPAAAAASDGQSGAVVEDSAPPPATSAVGNIPDEPAALAVLCSHCGAHNRPSAAFCAACGARLR